MSGLETSETGVNRSDSTGKPDYTLVDLDMLEREAHHMSRNVESKGRDNWRKASGPEDVLRFKQGAWRHFLKWVTDVDDGEDHAAALRFNISGVERARTPAKEDCGCVSGLKCPPGLDRGCPRA